MKKDNIAFVDIAKTIGIFLVVFAHLTIPEMWYKLINSFHMPLFFFISGYLFNQSRYTFKSLLKKKFSVLIVPYFFFAILSFLFWYFIESNFKSDEKTTSTTFNYLIGIPYATPDKDYLDYNLPIWFLPCLFVLEVIYFSIVKWVLKWWQLVITIFLFIIGLFINNSLSFRLPWGLDVALCSLIFFQIGNFTRGFKFSKKQIIRKTKFFRMILGLILSLIFFYSGYLNSMDNSVIIYLCRFHNIILFFITAISGIALTLLMSESLGGIKCTQFQNVFHFFGKNTLIILCLHILVISVIKGIFLYTLNIELDFYYDSVLKNLFMTVFVFACLIPIIIFFNKYLSVVLGSKTKKYDKLSEEI